jgi:hypothetical protein
MIDQLKQQTQYGLDTKLEQVLGFYEHELGDLNFGLFRQWCDKFNLIEALQKNHTNCVDLMDKVFKGETITEFNYFEIPAEMTNTNYISIQSMIQASARH